MTSTDAILAPALMPHMCVMAPSNVLTIITTHEMMSKDAVSFVGLDGHVSSTWLIGWGHVSNTWLIGWGHVSNT